jgi:hypothetical protein
MKVPSRAVVHAGGRTYEASSDFALGDGWSDTVRFTQDDVSRKFDVLATSLAPQSASWRRNVTRIASRIRRLEDVESVADLMRELSPLTFSAGAA